MGILEEKTIATLEANRDALITTVCRRLQSYADSHYEVIAFEHHQDREEALLDAFLDGLREPGHQAYLNYLVEISGQRSSEGYSLQEVQHAFKFFEETVWETLVNTLPCNLQLVEILATSTQIFTLGRDRMAQIFLQETIAMQAELEDLRDKFHSYYKNNETTLDQSTIQ